MFEELFGRVANLDVELKCLGTKAFVAKEQFVNDVFYSKPRKGTASEKEEKKAEMTDLLDQIKKDKEAGKDTVELEKELKEKMDEFLVSEKEEEKPVTKEDISDIMDQIQKDKEAGKDTAELEKELKEKMEKFLSVPKVEKKEEKPVVTKENISDIMDQIQKDKEAGKDTSELEKELKEKMDEFLVSPVEKSGTGAKRRVEPVKNGTGAKRRAEPVQSGTGAKRRADVPVVPDTGVTMDYSGQVQPGVTYTPVAEPSNNPYVDATGAVPTQEAPTQEENK